MFSNRDLQGTFWNHIADILPWVQVAPTTGSVRDVQTTLLEMKLSATHSVQGVRATLSATAVNTIHSGTIALTFRSGKEIR